MIKATKQNVTMEMIFCLIFMITPTIPAAFFWAMCVDSKAVNSYASIKKQRPLYANIISSLLFCKSCGAKVSFLRPHPGFLRCFPVFLRYYSGNVLDLAGNVLDFWKEVLRMLGKEGLTPPLHVLT